MSDPQQPRYHERVDAPRAEPDALRRYAFAPVRVGKAKTAYARVDVQDVHLVQAFGWRLHPDGYAVRDEYANGERRRVYLHRDVVQAPPGTLVDHINGDKLDNRRINLRLATHSENNANSRSRKRRSGFRGVYWHAQAGRWVAQISVEGRLRHLGLFDDPRDAARAYDTAARAASGPFARCNLEA